MKSKTGTGHLTDTRQTQDDRYFQILKAPLDFARGLFLLIKKTKNYRGVINGNADKAVALVKFSDVR